MPVQVSLQATETSSAPANGATPVGAGDARVILPDAIREETTPRHIAMEWSVQVFA